MLQTLVQESYAIISHFREQYPGTMSHGCNSTEYESAQLICIEAK